MEETKENIQFQFIPLKSLEETMTPKATSHTQAMTKIEQPPHMKDMNIEELMAQHMNKEQKRSLSNILEVKPEKEKVDNKEAITLMSGGELEELIREEVDANKLKELIAKNDESTSQQPNEKREVVMTFTEITPWGEMYEEFKIEKITPISKVEEGIVWLNEKIEVTIINKKNQIIIIIIRLW